MVQTTTSTSSSTGTTTTTMPPPSLSFHSVNVQSTNSLSIGISADLGSDDDKFTPVGANLTAVLKDSAGTDHTGSASQAQLDNLVDALNSQPGTTQTITLTLTVPPPGQSSSTSSPVVFDSVTITGSVPAVDADGEPKGSWPLNLTIDNTPPA